LKRGGVRVTRGNARMHRATGRAGPWAHRLRFLRRLLIRPASTSSGGGTGGLRIHVGAVVVYVGAVAE